MSLDRIREPLSLASLNKKNGKWREKGKWEVKEEWEIGDGVEIEDGFLLSASVSDRARGVNL